MATRFDDWEGQYLCHHGIQGMHWGVRRYQNKDGSLTKAGKRHRQKEYYKAFKYSAKSSRHDPVKNYEHGNYRRGYDIIPEDKREQLVKSYLKQYSARNKKQKEQYSHERYALAENTMKDLLGEKYMKKLGYVNSMRIAEFESAMEGERRRSKKQRRG